MRQSSFRIKKITEGAFFYKMGCMIQRFLLQHGVYVLFFPLYIYFSQSFNWIAPIFQTIAEISLHKWC